MAINRTGLRRRIWEELNKDPRISPAQLAKKFRVDTPEIIEQISQMRDDGLIDLGEAVNSGRIFIGHGRSPAWKDLRDFLWMRLGLDWDEFERDTPVGLAVSERLQEMLDRAVFAFLVFTAEDERADGSRHARENVVHELGLFQGKLGFRRAIILLEEECETFSNIAGLVQIQFPKESIMSKSDDIRRVLEREGLIQ